MPYAHTPPYAYIEDLLVELLALDLFAAPEWVIDRCLVSTDKRPSNL